MSALLTPKTTRRMAELERVLELAPGHGIAESFLSKILEEITDGETGMIMERWVFEDPAAAEANIRCLADRWASEDTLEEIQSRAGKRSSRQGKEKP